MEYIIYYIFKKMCIFVNALTNNSSIFTFKLKRRKTSILNVYFGVESMNKNNDRIHQFIFNLSVSPQIIQSSYFGSAFFSPATSSAN